MSSMSSSSVDRFRFLPLDGDVIAAELLIAADESLKTAADVVDVVDVAVKHIVDESPNSEGCSVLAESCRQCYKTFFYFVTDAARK